jgi:DNA (cytosine-5)-methyltransferase 1
LGTESPSFKVRTRTNRRTVLVSVERKTEGGFERGLLMEYVLTFDEPLVAEITTIKCRLYSSNDEDITMAWDAIEEYINCHTGYLSMMDLFGHFTEPHPAFSLTCSIPNGNDTFLLRFAKYFSDFETSARTFPESVLKELYGDDSGYDFLKVVQNLRSLRFDVRVNQTNKAIPAGYFKCCYPFTLHVDKQVSVGWTE